MCFLAVDATVVECQSVKPVRVFGSLTAQGIVGEGDEHFKPGEVKGLVCVCMYARVCVLWAFKCWIDGGAL